MSFEIKIHGVSLSARSDGRVGIAVENGSRTLSVAEFGSLVRLLDAVGTLVAQEAAVHPLAAVPEQAAPVVVAPATVAPATVAAAAVEVPVRRGPGRPRKVQAAPAPAAVVAPAAEVAVPVKRGPGRPRKIQAPAPAVAAVPAAAVGDVPVKRGPGRPRKNPLPVAAAAPAAATPAPVKRGPGRPRKDAAAVVVPAGDVPVKRGPGRPRKDASAVAPKAATPARAPKAPTLRDQLDTWMEQNPGPKTIAELVQAATDGQWPVKGDVRKLVETTVPRLHEAFVRTPDGAFVRRAEIEQAKPGKLVRRRRDEPKPTVPA